MQPFTYPGALQTFRTRGAQVEVLPDQTAGPRPGAKLLYAIADFQNPTGEQLDVSERMALLARAREAGVFIIEDAPYRDIGFEAEPQPPTLLQLDTGGDTPGAGRTLHLGSFSKSVAPGLRVGWVVGPASVIARLTLLRQASDLQPSTFSQAILTHLMQHDQGARLSHLRLHYARQRDALDAALQRHLSTQATWHRAAGGFFLWLKLARSIDTADLLPLALHEGVAYVPGSEFCLDTRGAQHLRLSFSSASPDRLEEGVRRLAKVIASVSG